MNVRRGLCIQCADSRADYREKNPRYLDIRFVGSSSSTALSLVCVDDNTSLLSIRPGVGLSRYEEVELVLQSGLYVFLVDRRSDALPEQARDQSLDCSLTIDRPPSLASRHSISRALFWPFFFCFLILRFLAVWSSANRFGECQK